MPIPIPGPRWTRRLSLLVVALALLASACSGDSGGSSGSGPTSGDAATETTTPDGPESPMAVVGADGSMRLVHPGDSAADRRLSTAGATASQPAFSPDGTRLAWSEIDADGNAFLAVSVIGGRGSGETRLVSVPFVSFYNGWDPTSTRVAMLGNSPGGVGLAFVEVGDPTGPLTAVEASEVVFAGRPLYVDWRSDGEGLIVHTDGVVLSVGLDGAHTLVSETDSAFQSPVRMADGSVLLVQPSEGGAADELVRIDASGDVEVVATLAGPVYLVGDPDRERLAVVVLPSRGPGTPDPDAVQVVYRSSGPREPATGAMTVPTLEVGVHVYDPVSGDVTPLIGGARVAAFWSPTGDRLLTLALDRTGTPASARWEVWAVPVAAEFPSTPTDRTEPFTPTATVTSAILPFFDQYADSMTPWSPDGTAFLYAALDSEGRPAIRVRTVVDDAGGPDPGEDPVAGEGVHAVWSPTAG